MAIYHLHVDVVQRSKGQSAVACAAYRTGGQLADERLGKTFDYARKSGVLHTEIVAPEATPAWMRDREQLWNAVEKVEKRKDSQLARDLKVALPSEFTLAQNIELVRSFVREEFVAQGMIADVAVHAPDRHGDDRNVHAHIMLTMRQLTGDGFGAKARAWNAKPELERWRADWAAHVNHALEREGFEARIDHRTLEEQGIDREPQTHVGPSANEMESRGVETDRGSQWLAIQADNAERQRLADELAAVELSIATLANDNTARDDYAPEAEAAARAAEPDAAFVAAPEPRTEPSRGQTYVTDPMLSGGSDLFSVMVDVFAIATHAALDAGRTAASHLGAAVADEIGVTPEPDAAQAEAAPTAAAAPTPEPPRRDDSPALGGGGGLLGVVLDLTTLAVHHGIEGAKTGVEAVGQAATEIVTGSAVDAAPGRTAEADDPYDFSPERLHRLISEQAARARAELDEQQRGHDTTRGRERER